MRPQRASRAMSTIGKNVQRIPVAEASRAAILADCSTSAGSQVDAIASGTGHIVRNPWMTSRPNTIGILRRDLSTAMRWYAFVSLAVEAGLDRVLEARPLGGDALVRVRLLRRRDVEERADLPLGNHVLVSRASRPRSGRLPGRVLDQLADLLLERHLVQQGLHPRIE